LPNCTSHLQLCDAGIIKSLKTHYASQLVTFFFNQLDNENTIVNCWNKCDILNNVVDSEINMLMRIDTSDVLHNIDYNDTAEDVEEATM